MLFLAKPESKEPKLSPDTAALLKAILPFQQVPSSSTTAGGSDWATKEITRGLESNNFSIPTPTTSTLLPSEVDHKVVSGASQIKDEHRIQEDKLDSKLKEFIRDNQEIAKKVEEIGYEKFKQQLIEAAKIASQKQNETKADSLKDKISFGIKELFGIQEAEASSVARQGIGLLGSTEIGKGEPVVAPTFSRMLANPKEEAIKWLVEHMDGGMLLTTLIALSAPSINEYNLSSEFEKRKHDDNSNKPSTSKQQQKVSAASFMPDPGDLEPDDDEKNVENKDEIKYKKSNYEKGDDIGLHRFTERFEKTKLRYPKSGQYLEPDFGRGSGSGGHGGSWWKLYTKSKEFQGTITKEGKWLRINKK